MTGKAFGPGGKIPARGAWVLNSPVGNSVVAVLIASAALFGYGAWRESTTSPALSLPMVSLASPDVDPLAILSEAGLRLQIFLLSPGAIGVSEWSVGDTSSYRYSSAPTSGEDRRRAGTGAHVEVTVLGQARLTDAVVGRRARPGNHWLRWKNLELFRDQGIDVYTLVQVGDLRTSEEAPRYTNQPGYMPSIDEVVNLRTCPQAELQFQGRVEVDVPAGRFACALYEVRIGDDKLRLWASPEVRPLGIVKLSSGHEQIELKEHRTGPTEVVVDPPMDSLVDGRSTLAYGCMSCHLEAGDCHSFVDVPR